MNILFQGKYSRTALKRYARDEQYKTTVMQVDQAALKFKDRIQLVLPPDVQISYNPDYALDKLSVFRDGERLVIYDNYYSEYSNLEPRSGESPEKWMARTIDKAKEAYEKYLTNGGSKKPLQEVTFQRVELVTELERKRLSGQITPWANVSESLANEFGVLRAEQVLDTLKSKATDFEKELGSDLTLDVLSLVNTPGITVRVKKKNPDGTTSPYQPFAGYDDSVFSQQNVPRFPKLLSWIPLEKPEPPAEFFNRALGHIRHLKKQDAERRLYQDFVAECKALEMDNFQVNAADFLHAYGWDVLKPSLITLKEYSGFIQKLDPNVHLTYAGRASSEEISVGYKDQGAVRSILGEMAQLGDDRFVVTRTKKQTPEQFFKTVFEKVKALLAERQRLENLLLASKPDEAFSF
jgi:hypothetical protein